MPNQVTTAYRLKSGIAGFIWALVTKLPTVVVVSLVVLALEHFGALNGLQTVTLDTWLLASSGGTNADVFIVGIDDEDYEQYFGGRSPLSLELLRPALDAIAAARPKAIGVDLDTSNPAFKNLILGSENLSKALWARDCTRIDTPEGKHELVREDILGGNFIEQPGAEGIIITEPPSGVTLFPQDADGLVRRYYQAVHTLGKDPGGSGPALCLSLQTALVNGTPPKEYSEEPLLLNVATTKTQRMYVHQLLKAAESASWTSRSPLANKIVLVGGMYHAARDSYLTPHGPRYGVELIAQAIATELRGGGIQELSALSQFLLDLVLGSALISLSYFFSGRLAFFLNLIGVVVLAIVGSWVAFRSLAYWFNYGAVLVGLYIHIQYEQMVERHALEHEVKELREKLAAHSK